MDLFLESVLSVISNSYLHLITISTLGLLISLYLFASNEIKRPIIPLWEKEDCNYVVGSSAFNPFGIPLSLFGILYYGCIYLFSAFALNVPDVGLPQVFLIMLGFTAIGFLFSLYLTSVQLFTLKTACSWCILSFITSSVLLVFMIFVSFDLVVPILPDYRLLFLIMHVFAVAIGFGGANLNDLMFFKFLKDNKISAFEKEVLNTFSKVIWFAIGIFIVSGLGLFLGDTSRYLVSSKFLTKIVVVGVIIINGIILNLYVAPKLFNFSLVDPRQKTLRRVAFAGGAISMCSWYAAFILGMLKSLPYSAQTLISMYGLMLVGAVIGGQILESIVSKTAIESENKSEEKIEEELPKVKKENKREEHQELMITPEHELELQPPHSLMAKKK